MDIHPFTNHDIARGRVAENVHRVRGVQPSVESDPKRLVEPGLRFIRRFRRRRAAAASQPRAI